MRDAYPIVVLLDGGPADDVVLKWAAEEAVARGGGLRLVDTYHKSSRSGDATGYDLLAVDAEQFHAEKLLVNAIRRVSAEYPDIRIDARASEGDLGGLITRESSDAELMVLNAQQLVSRIGALLHTVRTNVVRHVSCPMVVIGDMTQPTITADVARLTVGVDGSPHSDRPLEYAFGYAARYEYTLRIVMCWQPRRLRSLSASFSAHAKTYEDTMQTLDAQVERYHHRHPDVPYETSVITESPMAGLVTESKDSRLLVVGNRRRSRLTSDIASSLTHALVTHATCPVMVVPPGMPASSPSVMRPA